MREAEAKSDGSEGLGSARSALFLPASNARAIDKARASNADMVIIDLEDAVKPEDKDAARDAAVAALADDWRMPVAIRINGIGSEWHSLDLDAAARSKADYVVVPRATSAHLVRGIRDAVGKPVLAMIETAAGVIAAPEIAPETAGLIAGTNDLRAELGLPTGPDRSGIAMALQWIVLAARAAGVPAFDGVFNGLEDDAGFAAQAVEGKALGFTGKTLIHPRQIAPCHAAFAPSAEEVERSKRLVAAYDGGAARFEDQMIERMHVEAARRVLERASDRH